MNGEDKIRFAELRLPIPEFQTKRKVRVTLYRSIETTCNGDVRVNCRRREKVISLKVTRIYLEKNDRTVAFKATKLVRRWIKSTDNNQTIEVGIYGAKSSHAAPVIDDSYGDAHLITFTYTEIKMKTVGLKNYAETFLLLKPSAPLVKRAAMGATRRGKNTDGKSSRANDIDQSVDRPCERKDLIVDFAKIGWSSWIIYPKSFNAYQCVGSCKSHVDSNANNHAILQTMVREKALDYVPMPSCVPVKLSPLSMLYYERGVIVVKEHSDMIVDECGCR